MIAVRRSRQHPTRISCFFERAAIKFICAREEEEEEVEEEEEEDIS